jgi:hypothetical protein
MRVWNFVSARFRVGEQDDCASFRMRVDFGALDERLDQVPILEVHLRGVASRASRGPTCGTYSQANFFQEIFVAANLCPARNRVADAADQALGFQMASQNSS